MPAPLILYHNPRCSESRSVFDLLQERGIEVEVVRYLDTSPDLTALQNIFCKLGLESARGMMRVKDSLYQELGLDNSDLGNDVLLRVVAEHPTLLERPILITPDRAAIGWPLENIETLLPEQRETV